jgi:MFS family permease
MIILGGLGSFFIGASLQSAMPVFAAEVGAREVATAYGVLLFATGAGGLVGGLLLEATGRIKPYVKAALVSTSIHGLAILGFAITRSYLLAVTLVLIAAWRTWPRCPSARRSFSSKPLPPNVYALRGPRN